jgi:hypothetical protein
VSGGGPSRTGQPFVIQTDGYAGLTKDRADLGPAVTHWEVDGHRPLVPVHRKEVRRAIGVHWFPMSRVIAVPWSFDLGDRGAEVTKDHRCVWTGDVHRQVDDAEAFEREGTEVATGLTLRYEARRDRR